MRSPQNDCYQNVLHNNCFVRWTDMCAAANHYNVIHSKCVALLVGALYTHPLPCMQPLDWRTICMCMYNVSGLY